MSQVRVRFAPSPTGPLHIGGVRTALYNYLFARKHNGKFILRIEDTDRERRMEGTEEYITGTLDWLGISPDEGVEAGGAYGPYRQSDRKQLYGEYAQKLLASGNAYMAFDTPEEIEAMKEKMEEAGVVRPQYNSVMRGKMRNSLTLSDKEVEELLAKDTPYVIRAKIPAKEDIRFEDMIRGWVVVHSSTLDDKVLMKSDGMPTYHLANIVDDHLMKISHVIRGEEWLPSAPLHVLLYRFFGWESSMPRFAHLPLIMKPSGKGKLSKRDGLKEGIPVFPMEWKDAESGQLLKGFREEGFYPEAVTNFLALLGWNPGGERELFGLNELSEHFDLSRIIKGGARFDYEKAKWFNEQYLRARSDESLAGEVIDHATSAGIDLDGDAAHSVVRLMKERVTFSYEMVSNAPFLFSRPTEYDEKVVHKKWKEEHEEAFLTYAAALEKNEEIEPEQAKNTLESVLAQYELPLGKVMQALRVALTGKPGGPDLMEIIAFLGGLECAERIRGAVHDIRELKE